MFEEISSRKFEGLNESLLGEKTKLRMIHFKIYSIAKFIRNLFLIRTQWNFDRQKHLPFSQRFPSNPGGQLH